MKIGEKLEIQDGRVAEIISIIERDDEKYAVLALENKDDTSDIHVAKIIDNGEDKTLEETNDNEIIDYVLKIISNKVKTYSDTSKDNQYKVNSNDVINRTNLGSTRVTEENMDIAIDIMKQLAGNNK